MTLDRGAFIAATAGALVAQSQQTVRVLTVPTDAAKQILYAQQAGLFGKNGLKCELSAMGSGAAMFAAVLGGSADIAAGSLFPVFSAYGHGIGLRIIAPIAIYDTDRCDTWLIVRKDSAIRAPRDLNGKIIGSDTANDVSVASTRVWLDRHGGDGKSLRSVELKTAEQLQAIDQGRIDTASIKPPWLTLAMQSGRFRVLGKPLDAIAPRFLLSCWVATADYIAKNPAAVKGFVAAVTEGGRYANTHPAETVDMVAKFAGQDPALLRQGVRSVIATEIALADIQKPLDFAYTYGVIDKQYDARVMLSPFVPMTKTG
jgi:NitT/TauT family transport system substrate-binding protein